MRGITPVRRYLFSGTAHCESRLPGLPSQIDQGEPMPEHLATELAERLGDWAKKRGARGFTHLFYPVRSTAAGKRDVHVTVKDPLSGDVSECHMSARDLFQSCADGSSFPNGGLRQTHAALAHTAWDLTSPPFVLDGQLMLPSIFVTQAGEALDHKTPLLRSLDALSNSGERLLKLLGEEGNDLRVLQNVGVEQEFFLTSLDDHNSRPDLLTCGRVLFGLTPPNGQQMSDRYFSLVQPQVRQYMDRVKREMHKVGVSLRVSHNEVAPGQHEICTVYSLANRAADQNAMLMQMMRSIASQMDLAVLFHSKPFHGLNGTGKHTNFSLITPGGVNLLEQPSKNATPQQQRRFIAMIACVLRALHKHGDLARASVSTAANDFRLGAQEAPPAIISVGTGEPLEKHIDSLLDNDEWKQRRADGRGCGGYKPQESTLKVGARAVPPLTRPGEDRNRTSPFVFCGNRFEFRAVAGEQNISQPLSFLNAALCESFDLLADDIEARLAKGATEEEAIDEAVRAMLVEGRPACFNGDGYSEEWIEEAEKRGLFHLRTTPEALVELTSEKNIELLSKYGIFSEKELRARRTMLLEEFSATIRVEAEVLVRMVTQQVSHITGGDIFSDDSDSMQNLIDAIEKFDTIEDEVELAKFAAGELRESMAKLHKILNSFEITAPADEWPFATIEALTLNVGRAKGSHGSGGAGDMADLIDELPSGLPIMHIGGFPE
ncbi:MAG: hypothetical protein MHM6MM_000727 [Cercozoa sp. M6MM]